MGQVAGLTVPGLTVACLTVPGLTVAGLTVAGPLRGRCPSLASPLMRRLPISLVLLALLLVLLLAPAAQAHNDGRGFYGATNDKVVTNTGFILILFFPILVFVLTMIQIRLEKRKEARYAARKAQLGNARWRGGW